MHSQLKVSYKLCLLSTSLNSPKEIYEFLLKIWDRKLINIQEQVYMIYLNNNNQVIAFRCLCTGNDTEVVFNIKLAVSIALACMACRVIVAHNHPGQSLHPSGGDLGVTRQLEMACRYLDVSLVDHLIVTERGYYSFREHRMMK